MVAVIRKIECILCHQVMVLPSMPPKKYTDHLMYQHGVMFDLEQIVNRTLQIQHPSLSKKAECFCEKPETSEFGCQAEMIPEELNSSVFSTTSNVETVSPPTVTDIKKEFSKINIPEQSANTGMDKYLKSVFEDLQKTNKSLKSKYIKQEDTSTDSSLENLYMDTSNIDESSSSVEENTSDEESFMSNEESFMSSTPNSSLEESLNISLEESLNIKTEKDSGDSLPSSNREKKDEVDSSVSSDVENPKEIVWYQRCIFSCQLCPRQFLEKGNLKLHVENIHEAEFENYQQELGEKGTVKNIHECEICGKGLVWTKYCIESHVTKQHDLTLDQYFQQYKDDMDLPKLDITDSSLFSSNKQDKVTEDPSWANKCVYTCVICENPLPLDSQKKFISHISSVHKLSQGDYTKQFGRSSFQIEKHTCQVEECTSILFWDESKINLHLRNHDLSLDEYRVKYMENYSENSPASWANKCLFKCGLCDPPQTLESRKKISNHIKSVHKISPGDYAKEHGKTLVHIEKHTCQVPECGMITFWDESAIYQHLQKHDKMSLEDYEKSYMKDYKSKEGIKKIKIEKMDVEEHWSNKCIFKCILCDPPIPLKSRNKFSNHVSSVHKISQDEYLKTHGRTMFHMENHACQIENCGASFLWDGNSIRGHLKRKHVGMNIEEYNMKYMANYVNTGIVKKEKIKKEFVPKIKKEFVPTSSISWANKCIYECVICTTPTQYNTKQKFHKHAGSAHSITPKEYVKKYGATKSHVEDHTCQVDGCGSNLFWEQSAIYKHLWHKHEKMTLATYESNYMENYVAKPNTIKKKKGGKRGAKLGEEELTWANKCIFKCVLCKPELPFKLRNTFKKHVLSEHATDQNEYLKKHGRTMFHLEKHHCQVENCEIKITWDSDAIYGHIWRSHEKMKLVQYKEKYMENYVEKSSNNDSQKKRTSSKEIDKAWANRCIFKCVLCEPEIPLHNRISFKNHVVSQHQITQDDYQKTHGRTMVHLEKHHCQIEDCKVIMLWDSNAIYGHLKGKHEKMSLKQYNEKYMDNYTEKNKGGKNGGSLKELNWANKCIYECVICPTKTMYNTKSKFHQHMTSAHDISAKEYLKKYGATKSHVESHDCQVDGCNSTIFWEQSTIYKHLWGSHEKMTLDAYERKYMENYVAKSNPKKVKKGRNPTGQVLTWANKCIFKCVLCKPELPFKLRSEFKKHVTSEHKMKQDEYLKKHGRTMFHLEKHHCQVENCDVKITWDSHAIYGHFFRNHEKMSLVTYEQKYMGNYVEKISEEELPKQQKRNTGNMEEAHWATECIYNCKICEPSLNFTGRNRMTAHLKRQHELSLKDYPKNQGSPYVFKLNHTCQMCASEILWTRSAIKGHLMDRHDKISADEYFNTFMKNIQNDEPDWVNKITFSCKACLDTIDPFTTKIRSTFVQHTQTEHNLDQLEYNSKHGSMFNSKDHLFHSCQVSDCNSQLTWESLSLKPHIEMKHEMTVDNYFEKYMNTYSSKEDKQMKSEKKFKATKTIKEEKDADVDKWLAGSLYQCEICDTQIAGMDAFKIHLLREHNNYFHKYIKEYKDFKVKPDRFHCCKVDGCRKNIRWDKGPLTKHIREDHSMTTQDYFYEHKPKMPKLNK